MKYKMSKKYNYKNKIKESELQYIMYIFVQFGMKYTSLPPGWG